MWRLKVHLTVESRDCPYDKTIVDKVFTTSTDLQDYLACCFPFVSWDGRSDSIVFRETTYPHFPGNPKCLYQVEINRLKEVSNDKAR